ncbi:DNA polymerase Y family protein [Acidimicrobiia bacterium EGI L10123]|uniref:DNA polymerase Y family protein n=1 Tax=Salinilacustrithrix flava TaxID=2957203 RepID=UPI003D7C2791|nr:DNA polymerase Y family protein [Acidimicrobiia bacterium EGI L10123]
MTRLRARKVQPIGPPVDEPVRTMSVWVPDWPLVAAGVDSATPAAVFVANRVVACTAAARAAGVRRHMRRREAQSRAPSLEVLDHDPDRDARAFEAVVHAVEALTPRIEVTRPGRCAFPTRGPSRYFGGDDALASRALDVVAEVLAAPVAVGVADGPFAAAHAARTALVRANRSGGGEPPVWVVAPGRAAEYLAPLSLGALDRPELADVLARLGLHSLGDLAALPAADVLGRFGSEGLEAHRLACGLDPRPPATEPPPPDLVVSAELDPPAEQVAPIAFVARGMADELHARLDARGSVCTRIVISAETEHGERSERVWRHEGALSAGAIADRVRWQMDGWLHANVRQRPSAGIVHLWLHPDEVVAADGRQLGFWGADTGAADRAVRAIARVQGLLGADAVLVPEYAGGRDPGEQLRLVPAAAVDLGADRPAARPDWVGAPWPGRLPNPSPATLHPDAVPVDVLDARGRQVVVDGRCRPTAEPAALRAGRRRRRIESWAGPWPVDERWWDPERRSRRVRYQVVTDDGAAHLVVLEGGRWTIAATYD